MCGKFAIFFLVAVCLVQGYQSHLVEPRTLVEDAVNAITEVIEKIEHAISEITKQIPSIIQKLKLKIHEIIKNFRIDEIINSIQESINKILGVAGVDTDAVKDCIDAEKEAVNELAQAAAAGLATCKKSADDEVAELTAAVEELKSRADKMIADSTKNINQCIKEHGIHVVQVAKCLNRHLEELKKDTEALLAQIKDVIVAGNEKLVKVPIALTKCVADVNVEALKSQKKIVDDFKTCVDNHKQKPEQPEQ